MLRWVGRYLLVTVTVAVVLLPLVVEQAVERATFRDAVGTLPVQMSLSHDGRSTLQTGVLGDLYWHETGPWGFGVRARVTGPPQAGGTLASYVDPSFIRANLQFVQDPDAAVASYAAKFRDDITDRVVGSTVVLSLAGGALILLFQPRWKSRRAVERHPARQRMVTAGVVAGALVVSTGSAFVLFQRWEAEQDAPPGYAFLDLPGLRFSDPETLEVARQVRPFIEKNTQRIAERTAEFEADTEASFREALDRRGAELEPREGEVVVLAEADPQGGYVGTSVRTALVEALLERLDEDAVAMRTISGDITSNGTVAEQDFVQKEAAVGGELPTVAIAGDHDSETTAQQMEDAGMIVPDLTTEEVAGLRVTGANDVEHKALFGALVSSESDLTQQELGQAVRDEVDEDEPGIALFHQPSAAAGFLGLETLTPVRQLEGGSRTTPYDDGIDDVPPGTVNVGHLHDPEGPWVVWNTDGGDVTWTVVDQLGTSGGMEESPTFNRFSTPVSIPLKPMTARLQYFDTATGLQTGFATLSCSPEGVCDLSERTDVGLPIVDGEPVEP
ncbi:hypothetical protein [Nocardioides caldifontis]|uniref:hypothetical protein n=1 Tax=Nocardioides caldifontis TaxID=2588938 RepID=UPI0011DF9731|nr:hypothetical protein [Nocardioides caldifontis]